MCYWKELDITELEQQRLLILDAIDEEFTYFETNTGKFRKLLGRELREINHELLLRS